MYSILSVQNKICRWDWKKLIKILGTVASTKSCVYRQLDGNRESMWGFVMESPHFNTSSIRDKWHRWKSRSTSKRRDCSSIATIGIGWKVVVRFFGMQMLSAKCPRPHGRRDNSVWSTIWRTIQRTNDTLWSNGWISSVLTERSDENSSIWQDSTTWNLSRIWTNCGENLERRYYDSWLGRFGNDGRIGDLPSKNRSKRSIDQTEKWRIPFPIRRWNSKIVRKGLRIPRTHSKAGTTCKEWKSQWWNSRRNGGVPTCRTFWWRWSPWRLLVDSIICRHHTEPRVQLYVSNEKHFPFHWNTLMMLILLVLIWTSCKKRRLTITGMSIRANICETPGEDLQSSLYWKRHLQ